MGSVYYLDLDYFLPALVRGLSLFKSSKVEQFLEDVAKGFRILKRKLVMTEGSYMAAMG